MFQTYLKRECNSIIRYPFLKKKVSHFKNSFLIQKKKFNLNVCEKSDRKKKITSPMTFPLARIEFFLWNKV